MQTSFNFDAQERPVVKNSAMKTQHVVAEDDEILYSVVPLDVKVKESPVSNSDDY